mmetsp:Transcript_8140/g.27323  ORF Transcript_8140/g.27323 Transcript_8140/m.27323 type:complete len:116 (+) Transcript_8140:1058-1405(+)
MHRKFNVITLEKFSVENAARLKSNCLSSDTRLKSRCATVQLQKGILQRVLSNYLRIPSTSTLLWYNIRDLAMALKISSAWHMEFCGSLSQLYFNAEHVSSLSASFEENTIAGVVE